MKLFLFNVFVLLSLNVTFFFVYTVLQISHYPSNDIVLTKVFETDDVISVALE